MAINDMYPLPFRAETTVYSEQDWIDRIEWLKENLDYASWGYLGILTTGDSHIRVFVFDNEKNASWFTLRWA